MYYDITNSVELKSVKQCREARPDTSIPNNPTEQQLLELNIATVVDNGIVEDDITRVTGSSVVYQAPDYVMVYTYETIPDEELRNNYERNMDSVMKTEQYSALGDPALHRYTQAMTRVIHLVNARQQGATLSQEEVDFIDGSETGLDYQETNAIGYNAAKADLTFLTGQAIVDYPMPQFGMNPATTSGYQPYLDYLDVGYPL